MSMNPTKQRTASTQARSVSGLSERAAQVIALLVTIGVAGTISYGLNALFASWAG